MRGHRLDHVGDGEDAGFQGNGVGGQSPRIPGAVQAFMVGQYDIRHRHAEVDAGQDVVAHLRVAHDYLELQFREPAGLAEDLGRHGDLAHVVHLARQAQALDDLLVQTELASDGFCQTRHPALVTGRVRIPHLHRRTHGGDGPLHGALQANRPGGQLLRRQSLLGDVAAQCRGAAEAALSIDDGSGRRQHPELAAVGAPQTQLRTLVFEEGGGKRLGEAR